MWFRLALDCAISYRRTPVSPLFWWVKYHLDISIRWCRDINDVYTWLGFEAPTAHVAVQVFVATVQCTSEVTNCWHPSLGITNTKAQLLTA
jgi:hypothetical protein